MSYLLIQALIDYADGGDMKSVELMMKWGYEGVKKFIGGNPVQKIINSPRQVQEGLAVDLRACNDYKNGLKAAENISVLHFVYWEIRTRWFL